MSCKASLAALRLYGYFVIFVLLLSENKYDDDDASVCKISPSYDAAFRRR